MSVSKHGHRLLEPDAVRMLRERILPLATLVTPNLAEASALAEIPVTSRDDMRQAADVILGFGVAAVLVKGGHLEGKLAEDLFADGAREEWISAERIDTPNTHGTGCTLSAAIAAHLAMGQERLDAVRAGKAFVTEAIRHALAIGGDRTGGSAVVDPAGRTAVARSLRHAMRDAGDLAGLDAGRAGVHAPRSAVDQCANALDVRVPAPVVALVGEGHRLAEERLLPADLTHGCHAAAKRPAVGG